MITGKVFKMNILNIFYICSIIILGFIFIFRLILAFWFTITHKNLDFITFVDRIILKIILLFMIFAGLLTVISFISIFI